MSNNDDLICMNDTLLTPSDLRADIRNQLHEGHMAIEKSKNRSRFTVRWPGID